MEIIDYSHDQYPTETHVLEPALYPSFMSLLGQSQELKTPMKWEVLGSITLKRSSSEIQLPLYISDGDFILKAGGTYYRGAVVETLRTAVVASPTKSS